MKIHWAVFGERYGGHALLATSSSSQVATRIIQYTDRPGDPPLGVEWGPVFTGFEFGNYYILLKTLPDATAGRAGMVRTYAAFIPTASIADVGNLSAIFGALPSSIIETSNSMEALDVADASLAERSEAVTEAIRRIAARMTAATQLLPIVYLSKESYLQTVDGIWAKLPPELRPNFAFSFQFVPEHRIPASPAIVFTVPELAQRWPKSQILSEHGPKNSGPATQWLTNKEGGEIFLSTLRNYSIHIRALKDLNLLSFFVESVTKMPHLTFSEARKAIRILEKHSETTETSKPQRLNLARALVAAMRQASALEIETLRNFNEHALEDIIATLQEGLKIWISQLVSDADKSLTAVLESVISGPRNWWSEPFLSWLNSSCAPENPQETSALFNYLFGSEELAHWSYSSIPSDRMTEELLIASAPETFSVTQGITIKALALKRQWMRLHALVLLRTTGARQALAEHAEAALRSNEGLDFLRSKLGFKTLFEAACVSESPNLTTYVAGLLPTECSSIQTESPEAEHLLEIALRRTNGPIKGEFRNALSSVLDKREPPIETRMSICKGCATKDISILLEPEDIRPILGALDEDTKMSISSDLQKHVAGRIETGDVPRIKKSLSDIVGLDTIIKALSKVQISRSSEAGTKAFRLLEFLDDDCCAEWLIDLFTRSQFERLTREAAECIAKLLLSRDFKKTAKIVQETVEKFGRSDAEPILAAIRYKYQFPLPTPTGVNTQTRLPKVVIATALPLEREAVMSHLDTCHYDANLFADICVWPKHSPVFEIYVIETGRGNLDSQKGVLRILNTVSPKFAFFSGVCGAVKDNDIGDVVYAVKASYIEAGKEEDTGYKFRPASEYTSEALVQLAHRVAKTKWQPVNPKTTKPKASPGVIASGENVLASVLESATEYKRLRTGYNDAQVIETEAFGFLSALRSHKVDHVLVIRGVSDKLQGKEASDAAGNQPLAAENSAAFLFALLKECDRLLPRSKKKRAPVEEPERLPDNLL